MGRDQEGPFGPKRWTSLNDHVHGARCESGLDSLLPRPSPAVSIRLQHKETSPRCFGVLTSSIDTPEGV